MGKIILANAQMSQNGNNPFGNLTPEAALRQAEQYAIPFSNPQKIGGVRPVCAKLMGTLIEIANRFKDALQRGIIKLIDVETEWTSMEQQLKIATSAQQWFNQQRQQGQG